MRLAVFALLFGCASQAMAACPQVPPPVRDLDVPRFYQDAAGTKVDPAADLAHKRAVEPLTAFLRRVSQDADKSISRGGNASRREASACALLWLEAWARGGAWLGRMSTRQAEYQRKWDLAGASLAYLKVREHASAAQRAVIEPWLRAWADAALAFFDDPSRTRNNHWYWLGLGLAGVGLATDSDRHWSIARSIAHDAARDIADDGMLAKELERGARALHYHVFAAVPLVVMAELAAARREDWYALSNGALHCLVVRAHDGLKDPAAFERRIGAPMEQPVSPHSGWLPLYLARFPGRLSGPHPSVSPSHRWLGGNVELLSRHVIAAPLTPRP